MKKKEVSPGILPSIRPCSYLESCFHTFPCQYLTHRHFEKTVKSNTFCQPVSDIMVEEVGVKVLEEEYWWSTFLRLLRKCVYSFSNQRSTLVDSVNCHCTSDPLLPQVHYIAGARNARQTLLSSRKNLKQPQAPCSQDYTRSETRLGKYHSFLTLFRCTDITLFEAPKTRASFKIG